MSEERRDSREVDLSLPGERPSTLARRPDPELLERPDREDAGVERPKEEARKPRGETPRLSLPLFLKKFAELSLMSAFIGAVITYHLNIRVGPLYALAEKLNGGEPIEPGSDLLAHVALDFVPLFTQSMPVLEFKTIVWLLIVLLMIMGHLSGRLFERLFGIAVFAKDRTLGLRGRPDWGRVIPTGCILAFLALAIASFHFWGPVPPADAEALEGDSLSLKHAGYLHSLVAWIQVAIALVFFLVAEDLLRTRRLVYKLLGLIMFFGVLAALTAILLHVKFPGLSDVWVKWSESDYRNDVSAFIGHNTALSSFLMAPLFLLWTVLLINRDRFGLWPKIFLATAMAVIGLALLVAQSRAVIPIVILGFAWLTWRMSVRAAVRPTLGMVAVVPIILAVLVFTQLLETEKNPFFRRNIPLSTRFQHLTLKHLHTETRLRIFVCSLPVIRQNPLIGTGWASFHYVYPEAQGKYYQANPESTIMPTSAKTFRAHNEYLQTTMEMGLAGLALGLLGVCTILVSGWRTLTVSLNQRRIALQLAILTSIVAMLLHAFVDFPFRVPPLSCTLLLLLAVWSAGDRLWLVAVPGLEERASSAGEEEKEQKPEPAERGAWTRVQDSVLRVAWMALSLGLLAGVAMMGARSADWFGGAVKEMRATALIHAFADADSPVESRRIETLRRADAEVTQGLRLSPLKSDLYWRKAFIYHLQAHFMDQLGLEESAEGNRERAAMIRSDAVGVIQLGIEYLNRSLTGYRFHGSYKVRALFHHFLHRMIANPTQNFMLLAISDMERSVNMNPGDPDAIRILYEWKKAQFPNQEEEHRRLLRLLYHFHPVYFQDKMIGFVNEVRYMLEFEKALPLMEELLQVDPENPELRMNFAQALYGAGRLEEADRLATELEQAYPTVAGLLRARIALRESRPQSSRRILRRLESEQEGIRRLINLQRLLIEARLVTNEEDDEARRLAALREIDLICSDYPQALDEVALYLYMDYQDYSNAEIYVRRRLALDEPPVPVQTHVILARVLMAKHAEEIQSFQERRVEAQELGQAPAVLVTDDARADLEEAIRQFEQAVEKTEVDIHKRLLRERISELRDILSSGLQE